MEETTHVLPANTENTEKDEEETIEKYNMGYQAGFPIAHRFFPTNHARRKTKPSPSEIHRKADRVRDIRGFTTQLIQTLVSHGNLEGIGSLGEYKFVRGKTYRNPDTESMELYIDIHRKDNHSDSARVVGISKGVYDRIEQMMYLHHKQRKYTKNRQQRLVKKESPEQSMVTAFHFFMQKVRGDNPGMNIKKVLTDKLSKESLQKIQGIFYPTINSSRKEYTRYIKIMRAIGAIELILRNDINSLESFLELKRELGKIISISRSAGEDEEMLPQHIFQLLTGILKWMEDGIVYVKEVAKYIEKNEGTNRSQQSQGMDEEENMEPFYEGLTPDESEKWEDEYMLGVSQQEARKKNLEEWEDEIGGKYFDPDVREDFADIEKDHIIRNRQKDNKEIVYSDEVCILMDKIGGISNMYTDLIWDYRNAYGDNPSWYGTVIDEYDLLIAKIRVILTRNLYYEEYTTDEIMRQIDSWFLWLIDKDKCPLWKEKGGLAKEEAGGLYNDLIRNYLQLFSS